MELDADGGGIRASAAAYRGNEAHEWSRRAYRSQSKERMGRLSDNENNWRLKKRDGDSDDALH
ncbi:hypothetical protein QM012_002519 [Aureobasidium pullulans]|uniref:Uncharacterized protein n=1 Tax=Aureobasidium pullulans TaxID=5580 RepID=A0ABR0TC57_AURPU